MTDATDSRLLYLYSSNIRPLYEQDILDLLAAPSGQAYQFRYLRNDLPAEVNSQWNYLAGTTVLVHFAIQQEAEYHDPAFIPVRLGKVTRTERFGDVSIVHFCLSDYVSLRAPTDRKSRSRGKVVREYSSWLTGHDVPAPYSHWVGFGPDPRRDSTAPFHAPDDPMKVFDSTAAYLAKTSSFRTARFYRVVCLYSLDSTDSELDALDPMDGVFELAGGRSYGLRIAHMQPSEVSSRESFRVVTDGEILHPIGSGGFEISSRYDVLTVPLHAAEPPTSDPRASVVTIEPEPGIVAGRVQLRIRVVQPGNRTLLAVGGSTMAALLLGFPGLWPQAAVGVKALAVSTATLLLGLLAARGLRRT